MAAVGVSAFLIHSRKPPIPYCKATVYALREKSMIYLDNAASSHPKPLEVLRAVAQQLKENGANPGRSGHDMALGASDTVFTARSAIARAFGTEPEMVIFTLNTTDAINRGLKGLLRDGDHVVISGLEHNSVLRPLVSMREQGKITFDIVTVSEDDEETAARFVRAIRPNTRLIFCTHASNVTGQILPIREIGRICHRNGILFGVDGAQTAGIEAYDLKNDPIDLICVPGHKGLLGPQGTGALILARPLEMVPLLEGGTGSDSLSEHQPLTYPEGFESGTLNTPGLAGLREGVRFTNRHREAINRHERQLRRLFEEEVKKLPDYHVVSHGSDFVATVSLIPPRGHSEELGQWLNHYGICTRAGYHCSALAHNSLGTKHTGTVRISFGYRNTERDVYECVKYLKKY